MVTYNDKILVPNSTKDALDTIHPETNTSNVYDFNHKKWLNEILKIASTVELGLVKPDGTTIEIDSDTGVITAKIPVIQDGTTSQKGIVQLNNTVTSNSITQASTANAVKTVNDKFTLPQYTDVVLGSGWSTIPDRKLGYYKDSSGVVHLRGQIITAAATNGVVTTLPVGYRPMTETVTNFIGDNQNDSQIATIMTTGVIVINPDGKQLNVYIDTSFRTV